MSPDLVTKASDLSANTTTFTLRGVREEDALARFLDLLKDKIIVDLSPQLDECYALGPYTVFEEEQRRSVAVWGTLVYRAKYRRESSAQTQILAGIDDFIDRHLIIRTVDAVVSAPKGDPNTPDLVGSLAQAIANKRGWQRPIANKVQTTTGPQKAMDDTESEADLIARVTNTIGVSGVNPGARVLVLDDTIRSGGTLIDIARALREVGASEVYAISAAKDAKFTNGGVDLSKELWE
jgi:hypothetical protein